MKLAIFFLLCSVSLSFQQFYYPSHKDYRMAFFYPRSPSFYQPIADSPVEYNENSLFESGPMAYFDDIEGRVPNRGSIKAENRLFGTANLLAALINRLKNNTSSVSLSIPFLSTFTSIILKTSTLSKTVTSVQSCIGVSQFVVNGANTLTAVCARKRRGINIDDTKDLVEVIAPSQVEPLEITVITPFRNDRSVDQPEIASSQQDPSIAEATSSTNRQKRNPVVYVTSTITSYSFATTTVTKSFTLAAKNSLSCLPASYTVC